jgi:hypothetical protein
MLDVKQRLTMSLVSAAVMFASLLAHAQGVTSHYLGTPAPAFARWIIILLGEVSLWTIAK